MKFGVTLQRIYNREILLKHTARYSADDGWMHPFPRRRPQVRASDYEACVRLCSLGRHGRIEGSGELCISEVRHTYQPPQLPVARHPDDVCHCKHRSARTCRRNLRPRDNETARRHASDADARAQHHTLRHAHHAHRTEISHPSHLRRTAHRRPYNIAFPPTQPPFLPLQGQSVYARSRNRKLQAAPQEHQTGARMGTYRGIDGPDTRNFV